MTLWLPDGVPLEFVRIPAGTFLMGAPECEPDRETDEVLHEVTLTKDYWIGKFEVTNQQYRLFRPDHSTGPGVLDEPLRPVANVSWHDAVAFCTWASEATSRNVRLLTEAEWERACRAGSQTMYSYGDDRAVLTEYAWIFPNTQCINQVVGTRRPNAWGVFDMHGNVAEWVHDWYATYPGGPQTDPHGPTDNTGLRCFRECSSSSRPYECRCAVRDWSNPDVPYGPQLGFRVACDVRPEDGTPKPTQTPNQTPSPTVTRVSTTAGNLLANPGFELDARSDSVPTSWRESDECCAGAVEHCGDWEVPCLSGSGTNMYGWTLSSPGAVCSVLRQTLDTTEVSGELQLGANVYTRGPQARIRLMADPRGGTHYTLAGDWIRTDAAWQRTHLSIPADSYGPLLTVAVELRQEGNPEWIRVFVDDVSLSPAAPSARNP